MYLTDEQLAFRDSVRRMVAREVAPIAAEIDREDRFPNLRGHQPDPAPDLARQLLGEGQAH